MSLDRQKINQKSSLIQHFEADFQWKVSLKILNNPENVHQDDSQEIYCLIWFLDKDAIQFEVSSIANLCGT